MTQETRSAARHRVTVAQQTAERLRAELANGRWQSGDKLPSEAGLAEEFGVGRSSAREAVQSLARDGLLEVRHGHGIFAARPAGTAPTLSVEDGLRRARIVEVYEVRRAVEVEAARLAASRATAEELVTMRELLDRRQSLVGDDASSFVTADLRFHDAVVAAARNRLLSELYDQLHQSLDAALTDLVGEPGLPDTSADHESLLLALEAGDPDRAARATVAHFDMIIRMLQT